MCQTPLKPTTAARAMKKVLSTLAISCLMATPIDVATGAETGAFPYIFPEKKPNRPLSEAMNRLYSNYPAPTPEANELYSSFRFSPLEGFDYHDGDGTISRRDPSKIIRANGKYYVWYTRRHTPTPPRGPDMASETIPSYDWDLAEIWYATSEDGFVWHEQGVAVPRASKPVPGWRSVSTPDILVWKGKYYLYYQAYVQMPGLRGDDCAVSAAVADSPDGPWRPTERIIVPNGAPGEWDQYSIHDPYPLVYQGKIYLYYKASFNDKNPRVIAQGLAIADDPLGPFIKHPLNPVLNSGHETTLFPFREGIAALVIRNGLEHNTIQFAPDGVNFHIVAVSSFMPVAAGPYVPDAFMNTRDGRGITWGLCHITGIGGREKNHSILARFDCDLSQDVHNRWMKETDMFWGPEVYFSRTLNPAARAERARACREELKKPE